MRKQFFDMPFGTLLSARSISTVMFLALCSMLLGPCFPVEAQQSSKVPRIAYVMGRSGPMEFDEAFRLGLRELGYIEGQNITIEYRFGDGKEERLREVMAEAVRLNPDAIVTSATPAVLAAKNATTTIPIVMATSSDAVRDGLIASLARPGGNLTGLSIFVPELTGKRLELLKEILPRLSRVATIWNTANPGNALLVKDTELAARELSLKLQLIGVRSSGDFESAFASIEKTRAGALNVLSDGFMITNRGVITGHAVKSRLPSIFPSDAYVQAGGLLSYGPSLPATFRRAAYFVDKILKGAKPADIPVEQPTKFEFVINLKTAKQIGLTIPPNVLARADRVIK
jgi:putative ABC transport system substrate-binding protein